MRLLRWCVATALLLVLVAMTTWLSLVTLRHVAPKWDETNRVVVAAALATAVAALAALQLQQWATEGFAQAEGEKPCGQRLEREAAGDQMMARLANDARQQSVQRLTALTDQGSIHVPWTTHNATKIVGNLDDLIALVSDNQSLLIVGNARSGKTTFAATLAVHICHSGKQIPVLLSLAGWDQRLPFWQWCVEATAAQFGLDQARDAEQISKAIQDGYIILILDGFDELGTAVNDTRVTADEVSRLLDDARRQIEAASVGRALVLTTQPIGDLRSTVTNLLPSAATVEIRDLAISDLADYFVSSDPRSRVVWTDIIGKIASGNASALHEALSSPLTAWLAKTTYTPSVLARADQRQPSELLDRRRFPNGDSIVDFLLDGLTPAVFARRSSMTGPSRGIGAFGPKEATVFLRFLARTVPNRRIAFWEIRRCAPLFRLGTIAAVIVGIALGLASLSWRVTLPAATLFLSAGIMFSFGFSRGYSRGRDKEAYDPRRSGYSDRRVQIDGSLSEHAAKLIQGSLLVAIIVLLASLIALASGSSARIFAGQDLASAIFVVLLIAPPVGALEGKMSAFFLRRFSSQDALTGARAADPIAVYAGDFRSFCFMISVSSANLAIGYLLFSTFVAHDLALAAVILFPLGTFVATVFWNQWLGYKCAHLYLAARGVLPRNFILFLRESHRLGILRRSNNYFEFRHQRLQSVLARNND